MTRDRINRSDFISVNALAKAYLEECLTTTAMRVVESNLPSFRLDDDGKPCRQGFEDEDGGALEHPLLEACFRREAALRVPGERDPF